MSNYVDKRIIDKLNYHCDKILDELYRDEWTCYNRKFFFTEDKSGISLGLNYSCITYTLNIRLENLQPKELPEYELVIKYDNNYITNYKDNVVDMFHFIKLKFEDMVKKAREVGETVIEPELEIDNCIWLYKEFVEKRNAFKHINEG